MASDLMTLAILVVLQAVLGFDNLLYISIESKRVEEDKQAMVRRVGLVLAIALRIVLLFVVIKAIDSFQKPFFEFHLTGILEGAFNVHSFIVLLGGGFILYTALKEISHMLVVDDIASSGGEKKRSLQSAIFWIVIMNLVFSFDSILSAMALSDNTYIMATAIIIGGMLMIWLADHVSTFLQKNRLYEVLGLFILFVVGIMLLTEGGHLAHMEIAGQPITPMNKMTFYFVIAVLVMCDVVQSRYQRKLMAEKAKAH